MTDLDRYLTDEVAETALAAGNAASECYYGCPSDMTTTEMHAALAAVLPDIIRQAKAEAIDERAAEMAKTSIYNARAIGQTLSRCVDLIEQATRGELARADRIEQGGQP